MKVFKQKQDQCLVLEKLESEFRETSFATLIPNNSLKVTKGGQSRDREWQCHTVDSELAVLE